MTTLAETWTNVRLRSSHRFLPLFPFSCGGFAHIISPKGCGAPAVTRALALFTWKRRHARRKVTTRGHPDGWTRPGKRLPQARQSSTRGGLFFFLHTRTKTLHKDAGLREQNSWKQRWHSRLRPPLHRHRAARWRRSGWLHRKTKRRRQAPKCFFIINRTTCITVEKNQWLSAKHDKGDVWEERKSFHMLGNTLVEKHHLPSVCVCVW